MKLLNRKCPICNSLYGEVLHTQKFILEQGNPLPNEYDVICCEQCHFIYADTDADQKVYNEYYENFSKYESLEVSSGAGINSYDKNRISAMVSDIIEFIPNKKSKILDIGAAMGGVLNELYNKNYNNLFALEPSQACVDLMIKNNIVAFQGNLFDDFRGVFKEEKFDFIILSHVFEHIYDFKKAILNIRSILKDNGKIYIEVPNASRYSKFYVVPYYYFDIEHINHFDKFSLSTLMANYGLESITLQEKKMQVSSSIEYPTTFGVFTLNNKNRNSVTEYISTSKKMSEENYNSLLDSLVLSKEECVVWGAGNFTKRLLAQTSLDKCNIIYFIDKDNKKQEKYIKNVLIKSPKILDKFKGTVIVASALFSSEIVEEIKSLNCRNKIIVLS